MSWSVIKRTIEYVAPFDKCDLNRTKKQSEGSLTRSIRRNEHGVDIVKILFWNLKENENSKYINCILSAEDIDIAVFAEYQGLDLNKLDSQYQKSSDMGGCDKVIFISKNTIPLTVRREGTRYAIYSFSIAGENFLLVGLHLPANPHSNADGRKDVIFDIKRDIIEQEKLTSIANTIVIGDFNASPFDSELTQKTAFDAVFYKNEIMNQETVRYNGKIHKRFYNPLLNYISETNEMYGSFRYISDINDIVWYCYDQIIVRKPLVERLENVRYMKKIDKIELLSSKGVIMNSISDHLPLIVEVN